MQGRRYGLDPGLLLFPTIFMSPKPVSPVPISVNNAILAIGEYGVAQHRAAVSPNAD